MCYGYDGEAALERSLATRGVDRRGFLSVLAGAAAAVGGVGAAAGTASATTGGGHGRRVPRGAISIQLYTLRDAMTDWASAQAVLAELSDIGYRRVEMAGTYGQSAETIKDYLRSVRISASSAHLGLSADAASLEQKLEDARTLGHRSINVPYLASEEASDWYTWADQINAEAVAARRMGIRYGYHNHAHEFTTDLGGGLTPWDIFTSELDPRYVHLEADLYWVVTGGIGVGASDPIQFTIDTIHEAPQHVRQYHVKDKHSEDGDMADLGTGFIDFSRIFAEHRVTEYIVENDTPDVTPIQTAEVGYAYLKDLRY